MDNLVKKTFLDEKCNNIINGSFYSLSKNKLNY